MSNTETKIVEIEEGPTDFTVKAAKFANFAHRNQRRKGTGEPYMVHPVTVATNLVVVGGITDYIVIAAALLHDTVEDTPTTLEVIEREFGTRVKNIVAEVTDDKKLKKVERKKLQVEHAPHKSREAKLVKLADKLSNLTDLMKVPIWDKDRIQGYFAWAYKVVEGLRGTNQGLEKALDEVFKSQITMDGETFSVLPPEEDIDTLLNQYYCSLQLVSE